MQIPKIGTLSINSLIVAIVSGTSVGSPGPLLNIIPSGFCLKISLEVALCGITTISQSLELSSLIIPDFIPKSSRTTLIPLPDERNAFFVDTCSI